MKLGLLLILLACADSTRAATVTYTISSTFNAEEFGGEAAVPFKMVATVSDSPLGDTNLGWETYAIQSASVALGPDTAIWVPSEAGYMLVSDDALAGNGMDTIDFQLEGFSGTVLGRSFNFFRFALFDTVAGSMVTGLELPVSPSIGGLADTINVSIQADGAQDSITEGAYYDTDLRQFTVTVPEPATASFVWLGGMALCAFRRRQRK